MSEPSNSDAFFIGWEARPAARITTFLKKITIFLVVIGVVIAGVVAALQGTMTSGTFDFGNVQAFSGILIKSPVPMLIADSSAEGNQVFYLVAPFKNGFPLETAAKHHLQHVSLKGTFIGDALDSMLEVVTGSVSNTGTTADPLIESVGTNATVRGEIVDSKCHLGVMNPGRFKPHRACAIQCIKGGIPPIIVARSTDGTLAHYVMVGTDGSAINEAVLPFVAEPVEVSGVLKEIAGRKVLYVDPAGIRRR